MSNELHGDSLHVGWSSWTQFRCGVVFMDVVYVTGRVIQIWTTQDDTNDDGIFRLSTWRL